MSTVHSSEVYKDIPGFSNYKISNYGKLFSKTRSQLVYNRNNPFTRTTYGKRLFGSVDDFGNKFTTITNDNGKYVRVMFKQLIALAFLGERPKRYFIEAIDGDDKNIHADNLKYSEIKVKQPTIDRSKLIPVTEDMQHSWDLCLLTGWSNCSSMRRTIKNFCLIENPLIVFNDEEIYDWFYQLNLQRTGKRWEAYKFDVRAFVGSHSTKLSSALFSNKMEDCLNVINSFPWRDCVLVKSQADRPRTGRYKVGGRSFSDTQWNKVK